jgi:hypothetical protein
MDPRPTTVGSLHEEEYITTNASPTVFEQAEAAPPAFNHPDPRSGEAMFDEYARSARRREPPSMSLEAQMAEILDGE